MADSRYTHSIMITILSIASISCLESFLGNYQLNDKQSFFLTEYRTEH